MTIRISGGFFMAKLLDLDTALALMAAASFYGVPAE
jgi:hypothetical protein